MSHSTWYNGTKRSFIETQMFQNHWTKLSLTDDDLSRLQQMLLDKPKAGDVIPGTNGIRKLRFPIYLKGKRGGARIIYLDIVVAESIVLLDVYSKHDLTNITELQKKQLSNLSAEIKRRLRK